MLTTVYQEIPAHSGEFTSHFLLPLGQEVMVDLLYRTKTAKQKSLTWALTNLLYLNLMKNVLTLYIPQLLLLKLHSQECKVKKGSVNKK